MQIPIITTLRRTQIGRYFADEIFNYFLKSCEMKMPVNVDWSFTEVYLDSKVHGANMGPTWALSAPDGPHEPWYQGISTQCVSIPTQYASAWRHQAITWTYVRWISLSQSTSVVIFIENAAIFRHYAEWANLGVIWWKLFGVIVHGNHITLTS